MKTLVAVTGADNGPVRHFTCRDYKVPALPAGTKVLSVSAFPDRKQARAQGHKWRDRRDPGTP